MTAPCYTGGWAYREAKANELAAQIAGRIDPGFKIDISDYCQKVGVSKDGMKPFLIENTASMSVDDIVQQIIGHVNA